MTVMNRFSLVQATWIVAALIVPAACSTHADMWRLTTASRLSSSSGRPHITKIEDLGTAKVPTRGRITPGGSDGIIVPGEVILVRGSNFGRLPTLLVGKKPTSVIGRTEDGGILARVPHGVESPCRVTVTTTKGTDSKAAKFHRLLVRRTLDGAVVLLDVTGPVPKSIPIQSLTAVVGMTLHRFGSVAYLLQRSGRIVPLDLAAPGTPKAHPSVASPGATVLAASAQTDLLATAGQGKVSLWDLTNPLHPSLWKTYSLPTAVDHLAAIALSPDGKTLAAATNSGLLLADVTDPLRLRWAGKAPTKVTNLGIFDITIVQQNPKAGTPRQVIWAASGDTPQTLTMESHGIEIMSGTLEPATSGEDLPKITGRHSLTHRGAWVPTKWGFTFATNEVVSGTALRQDPARMLIYLPALSADLLRIPKPYDSPAGRQSLSALAAAQQGSLFLLDGSGKIRKALATAMIAQAAVSTTGRRAWAVGCRLNPPDAGKTTMTCGLLVTGSEAAHPRWFWDKTKISVDRLDDLSHQGVLVQP